jgi:hypothetical protein
LQDRDVLLVSAEVAVTFAGFASLVALFGSRASRDGLHIDGNRLRTMVACSLLVVALALFPFVPLRYGFSEALVWRISSAALLLGGIWLTSRIARDYGAVRAAGIRIQLFIRVLNSGLVFAALGLALANLFGASDPWAAANYLAGLLALLALAGVQFARLIESLVLAPPATPDRGS